MISCVQTLTIEKNEKTNQHPPPKKNLSKQQRTILRERLKTTNGLHLE